ncbi:TPA: hypothetical protein N0F65_002101 [Lagenidium giganteum]|uniref:Chorein N-terminal domain-containing protein n=1 Tax=Lagenidium giganteum TaxID=4803 RepID=A0AAV2ZHF7_9STRA|nr:TPA: hypothetical protein N0F65_002101 [Lagenidium giganteum]
MWNLTPSYAGASAFASVHGDNMFDILSSPLRGYIAQNLQFYLSKYIEGIQLEGLGIFGGDLVLNDLEIKRHVLKESLEIPSSFDFSRGFIRELRIHIPWTQLLSQPIEVKLYTIELILTARSEGHRQSRSSSIDLKKEPTSDSGKQQSQEQKIDEPKVGWLHDTLQKILSNITVQVNNLVLKYQQDDMVLSVALGTLDFFSASEQKGWIRGFQEPEGPMQMLCKRVDAKDLTIFLDRYTSDRKNSTDGPVHRRVVGYEVPVLNRTSISIRAKTMLKPKAHSVAGAATTPWTKDTNNSNEILHRPSLLFDPFFAYSRHRQQLQPHVEIDALISELSFSLSDRQLKMLNQLINVKRSVVEGSDSKTNVAIKPEPNPTKVDLTPAGNPVVDKAVKNREVAQSADSEAKPRGEGDSWFGWAMSALGVDGDEEEDELVSEILEESKNALMRQQMAAEAIQPEPEDTRPQSLVTCVRLCISSTSLTLRRHVDDRDQPERSDDAKPSNAESVEEELVPVANVGLVKVPLVRVKSRVSRPAVPVCRLDISYSAFEMIIVRGDKAITDLVFEIEKIELASVTDTKETSDKSLLLWGAIDDSKFADCVSHPYFNSSFYGPAARRLNHRESRSFELVKLSFDSEIPVWKTVVEDARAESKHEASQECDCSIMTVNGTQACTPLGTIADVCDRALGYIGLQEPKLDIHLLSSAVKSAWPSSIPVFESGDQSSLVQIVDQYLLTRDADMPAVDNLRQLLYPQLLAWMCRRTLHKCASSLLDAHGADDLRRRSVHSAMRLRWCSVQDADDELSKESATCHNVLDLSIGKAVCEIDLQKSAVIIKLVGIVSERHDHPLDDDTATDHLGDGKAHVQPDEPTSVQMTHLITVAEVSARVPAVSATTDGFTDVEATVRGVVVSTFKETDQKLDLEIAQFGLELGHATGVKRAMASLLGARTAYSTSALSDQDAVAVAAGIAFDRLAISVYPDAVLCLLSSGNGIARLFDRAFLEAGLEAMQRPRVKDTAFDFEVLGVKTSVQYSPATSSSKLDVVSAQAQLQTLCMVQNSPDRFLKPTLGFCAGMSSAESPASPSIVVTIKKEVSSGSLVLVPFLPSHLASSWTGRESIVATPVMVLTTSVRLGYTQISLPVLLDLSTMVNNMLEPLTAKPASRKTLLDNTESPGPLPSDHSSAVHASWRLTFGLHFDGGQLLLSKAVSLALPGLRFSNDSSVGNAAATAGGRVCFTWAIPRVSTSITPDFSPVDHEREMMACQGVGGTLDYTHTLTSTGNECHELRIKVLVQRLDVSLSRLQVDYELFLLQCTYHLLHLPFLAKSDTVPSQAPELTALAPTHPDQKHENQHTQLVEARCSLNSKVVVAGRDVVCSEVSIGASDLSTAIRLSNHKPIHRAQPLLSRSVCDFQLNLQGFQMTERLMTEQHRKALRSRFGSLHVLNDSTMTAILLCLDTLDLCNISQACHLPVFSAFQHKTSNPMLSWRTTSQLVKLLRRCIELQNGRLDEAGRLVPLLSSWSTVSQGTQRTTPFVSMFYRNYGDSAHSSSTLAAFVDDVDVVLTSSSLCCIASHVNLLNSDHDLSRDANSSSPTIDSSTEAPQPASSFIVSIAIGRVRIIFPDEVKDRELGTLQGNNICLVVDSAFVRSSDWVEISLEGLGNPPFNSTMLPRRLAIPAQRFGNSVPRLSCRLAGICGQLMKLQDSSTSDNGGSKKAKSPLDAVMHGLAGKRQHLIVPEVFIRPFSCSCNIESDGTQPDRVSLLLTKIQVPISSETLHMVATGVIRVVNALGEIEQKSEVLKNPVMKPPQQTSPDNQTALTVDLDGIDISIRHESSIHLRVGATVFSTSKTGSCGSFLVHNVVVGFRPIHSKIQQIEELVFGPYSDPASWLLSPDNLPDKLVTCNWTPAAGSPSETTVFIDVRGFQTHVTAHFLSAIISLSQFHPVLLYSLPKPAMSTLTNKPPIRHYARFSGKTGLKVLIGPSLLSVWESDSHNKTPCVWIPVGQTFASATTGNDWSDLERVERDAGHDINPLTRLVSTKLADVMINLDRFAIKTSMNAPPLHIGLHGDLITSSSTSLTSNWSKHAAQVCSSATKHVLLHDCGARVTAEAHQVLEREKFSSNIVMFPTALVGVTGVVEFSLVVVKVSSYSLAVINNLLATFVSKLETTESQSQSEAKSSRPSNEGSGRQALSFQKNESTDDFECLRRIAEPRNAAPGELVLSEALAIETGVQGYEAPDVLQGVTMTVEPSPECNLDPNRILQALEAFNRPWHDDEEKIPAADAACIPIRNKTISWMTMRWTYHVARKVQAICANPVPLPPTGIPAGWPLWWREDDETGESSRPCDLICQLRCWDHKRNKFVTVADFCVPWESVVEDKKSAETQESSSFGELIQLWFDGTMSEEQEENSRLLRALSKPRRFVMKNARASDKWELRWRIPLTAGKSAEYTQRRLLINTVLASSLEVESTVAVEAYQRVYATVSSPHISCSITHISAAEHSYDVLTTHATDTTLVLRLFGYQNDIKLHFSTTLQVFLENMVQLVTTTVIPRVVFDGVASVTPDSIQLSVVTSPIGIYLSQTSLLVLSSLDGLLQPSRGDVVDTKDGCILEEMRIVIVNECGQDIWFRQDATVEELKIPVGQRVCYSWLTLATSPHYQMQFAMATQKPTGTAASSGGTFSWSDPCRIKDNGVTARFFKNHGFLWICVELQGLKTVVTLRPPMVFRNMTKVPLMAKVDDNEAILLLDKNQTSERDSTSSHQACVCGDPAFCGLARREESTAMCSLMGDSIRQVALSVDDRIWSIPVPVAGLPAEFDLVRGQSTTSTIEKRSLVELQVCEDSRSVFVCVVARRTDCLTILPNDFDLLQPRVLRRYTWLDISFWPACALQNLLNESLIFKGYASDNTLVVQGTLNSLEKKELTELSPLTSSRIEVMTANPEDHVSVLLKDSSDDGSASSSEFFSPSSAFRVVAHPPSSAVPSMIVQAQQNLRLKNDSSMTVCLRLNYVGGLDTRESSVSLAPNGEHSLACPPGQQLLAVALSRPRLGEEDFKWGSELLLSLDGDRKTGLSGHEFDGGVAASHAFVISLVKTGLQRTLSIRPLIVAFNHTPLTNLLSSQGAKLEVAMSSDQVPSDHLQPELVLDEDEDAHWCVPVLITQQAEARRVSERVSSWLSSAFSGGAPEPSPERMKTSVLCRFRVSLVDSNFVWSEEVDVDIQRALQPRRTAKAESAAPAAYPAPSSLTPRRRLLVQHKQHRHLMLTYTITEVDGCIQILMFVDHQPPVVLVNEWRLSLGFRIISTPSMPESIGSKHTMRYDWQLQTRFRDRGRLGTELQDWLSSECTLSAKQRAWSLEEHVKLRFQIGSRKLGWSNTLWQVSGIQFASFDDADDETPTPTFLVTSYFRSGTWHIRLSCVEDPLAYEVATVPASNHVLTIPSFTSFRLSILVEELALHCLDEFDPVKDERDVIVYPEIFRVSFYHAKCGFSASTDVPEVSLHDHRLGYLDHIRSYHVFFISVEDLEVDHFLQDCEFPVIFSFPQADGSAKNHHLLPVDTMVKHDKLADMLAAMAGKELTTANDCCVIGRVIYAETANPTIDLPFFHTVELNIGAAVLQVEDAILSHIQAFVRPVVDAMSGIAVAKSSSALTARRSNDWTKECYERCLITCQRRIFIGRLKISDLQLTITARVSIPVINSFDGTPLSFSETDMRDVLSFGDQLLKDLAANYVADAIVRSPMLLMSLNILGNPMGFFRNVGSGFRDLFQIPVAATRNGYSPWVLTRGVVGGISALLGRTSAAVLMSLAGFSYSISRTMDSLTLPPEQLRMRHYQRPTGLSTAITSGLGSLGSSVVGAATGVVTTPIAIYKERKLQGLDAGVSDVLEGVGKGLVGVIARPMGGIASLVSMTTDGLLVGSGMGADRMPEDYLTTAFEAWPNEMLRFKLKVLPDSVGELAYAHGVWVDPHGVASDAVGHPLTAEEKQRDVVQQLLVRGDAEQCCVAVAVLSSRHNIYVVGRWQAQQQWVLHKTPLFAVRAIEESLTEPSRLDLGIKSTSSTTQGLQWLRFRLSPAQRRTLSHHIRLWLAEVGN